MLDERKIIHVDFGGQPRGRSPGSVAFGQFTALMSRYDAEIDAGRGWLSFKNSCFYTDLRDVLDAVLAETDDLILKVDDWRNLGEMVVVYEYLEAHPDQPSDRLATFLEKIEGLPFAPYICEQMRKLSEELSKGQISSTCVHDDFHPHPGGDGS
jgi:hypothetical protein